MATVIPWTGGINTSTDSGIIPNSDLVIADNVLFSSTGARVKRENHTYWDALSDVPTVTHRASTGTTRTLTFDQKVSETTIDRIVAGEGLIITTANSSGDEVTYYASTGIAVDSIAFDGYTISYTGVGSFEETTTATTTLTVTRQYPIVRVHDYWHFTGSGNAQEVIAVTAQPKIFKYDTSGRRKEVEKDSGATVRVGSAELVDSTVFNEALIVAQSRLGNTPIRYKPEDDSGKWTDLAGSPPDFSIMAKHLNRIWTNDKNNPDRIHYCSTGNAEEWQGIGDSGAIDVRPGDGDPRGVVGIRVFKGQIFISKSGKEYRIVGDSPENFQVLDVSQGIGSVAHLASAAVDQDDVLYLSPKGAHSTATTANYGDFQASYLSAKIQPTYTQEFERLRLNYAQAVYSPTINSVAFSVSENSTSLQDTIWLYNTQVKEWYRWPNISAQSLGLVLFEGTPTIFVGTADGRLIATQQGEYSDFGSEPIKYRIKTGTIYPDGSPSTVKAFKRLTLFYRPVGTYNFTCKVKIDSHTEQVLVFSQTDLASDRLDIDFILGQSFLGTSSQFAPNTQPIDGIGRGITIEIEQAGTNEQIAIYGFEIEFEGADLAQEVDLNPSGAT